MIIHRVAIEEVLKIEERRSEINSFPLKHILWTKGGKPLNLDRKTIEDWELTGLSNIDFVIFGEFERERL